MNNNVLKISEIETSSLIDKQSGYDLIFLNDMLLNAAMHGGRFEVRGCPGAMPHSQCDPRALIALE